MAEQRIQKVLADQGICSRREAERLIAAGKVKVNGHPVTLGDKMDPDYDKVMIDGQTQRIVRKRQYTYIMLHKPRGYLTTRSDDRGRKTVMDLVSDVPAMLRPVGRLDKDSEVVPITDYLCKQDIPFERFVGKSLCYGGMNNNTFPSFIKAVIVFTAVGSDM